MAGRRKLIAVSAGVAAVLATTVGAAFAADSGPSASPTNSGAIAAKIAAVKNAAQKDPSKRGVPADITKAAADLGVSVARLEDAFVQTKVWMGTSGVTPTPDVFAAHVASVLGKPADEVLRVLTADGVIGPAPDKKPR